MAAVVVVDDADSPDQNVGSTVIATRWTPQCIYKDELPGRLLICTDDDIYRGYEYGTQLDDIVIENNMGVEECGYLYNDFLEGQFWHQNSHECDLLLHDALRSKIYIQRALEKMTPPHMLSNIYSKWHVENLYTPVPLGTMDTSTIEQYRIDPVRFRETNYRKDLNMVFRECVKLENGSMYRSRHINCPCVDNALKQLVLPLMSERDKVRFMQSHI